MTFSEKYYEGQISAGSTNPADDLRVAIAANIVNVTGWTVIDDGYTSDSVKRSVLKLDSATSGLATHMYLVLSNYVTAATTDLYAYVSEAYDTGTHFATYPAYPASSTDSTCRFTSGAPNQQYWYSYASSGTLYGREHMGFGLIIRTAVSGYWAFNAYATHILITTNTTTQPLYFGKFTSLVTTPATNDPNPITMFAGGAVATSNCSNPAIGGINPGSRHMACFTRWAMNPSYTKTANGSSDWYVAAYAQYPYFFDITSALSSGYYSSTTDPYSASTGIPVVPVCLLNMAQTNATENSGTSKGLWRGKLIDIGYIAQGTWGDYLTIGGSTYQCAGNGYYFRKTV